MSDPKLIYMPLFIADLLADTTRLDNAGLGSYLLLMFDEFLHGPLPNDPEQLMRTAKMLHAPSSKSHAPKTVDAPSIAVASPEHQLQRLLSTYFSQQPDGTWIQKRVERDRVKLLEKRRVNHERAQKAANARWNKRRKEKEDEAKKNNAPSIAQAVLGQCQPELLEEVQKPSAQSLRSFAAAPAAAPDAPSIPVSTASIENLPAGPRAPEAPAGARDGSSMPSAGRGARVTAMLPQQQKPQNGAAPHKKPRGDPDPRHTVFKGELQAYWRGQNPGGRQLPWAGPDAAALADLLRASPELDLAGFRQLLEHRAQSDVNPADLPRAWLRDLMRFTAGSLDRFNKLKTERRGRM